MADTAAMGRAIREARLQKGMSLGQLAAAVGRSSSSVRRWERGEVPPAIGVVDQLADVLDLDPEELKAMRPAAEDDVRVVEAVSEAQAPAVKPSTLEQPKVTAPAPEVPAPTTPAPRGFLGDTAAALRDMTADWSGWIRGLLTAVVVIVMLIVLVWALGQLFDALRVIWDGFDTGTSP
jgi:transcriptional regulator with XRE-family HTH domain